MLKRTKMLGTSKLKIAISFADFVAKLRQKQVDFDKPRRMEERIVILILQNDLRTVVKSRSLMSFNYTCSLCTN